MYMWTHEFIITKQVFYGRAFTILHGAEPLTVIFKQTNNQIGYRHLWGKFLCRICITTLAWCFPFPSCYMVMFFLKRSDDEILIIHSLYSQFKGSSKSTWRPPLWLLCWQRLLQHLPYRTYDGSSCSQLLYKTLWCKIVSYYAACTAHALFININAVLAKTVSGCERNEWSVCMQVVRGASKRRNVLQESTSTAQQGWIHKCRALHRRVLQWILSMLTQWPWTEGTTSAQHIMLIGLHDLCLPPLACEWQARNAMWWLQCRWFEGQRGGGCCGSAHYLLLHACCHHVWKACHSPIKSLLQCARCILAHGSVVLRTGLVSSIAAAEHAHTNSDKTVIGRTWERGIHCAHTSFGILR